MSETAPRHPERVTGAVERVDIIIPVHNQVDYTRACLDGVAEHTRPPYGVIVIDNGSTDGTPSLLSDLRAGGGPIEVLANPTNVGFTPAANQGLRHSDAGVVILLNNDTVVTAGWLEGLLTTAASDEAIGVVGPRLLDPRTDLLHGLGGLVFHRTGARAPVGQGAQRQDPRFAADRDCQYAEGACMLIKRRVLDTIGYLDEAFAPGYYEDVDYCFRARQAGFRVVCSGGAEVYHHVNVTANALRQRGAPLSQAAQRNDRLFRERWGHLLPS